MKNFGLFTAGLLCLILSIFIIKKYLNILFAKSKKNNEAKNQFDTWFDLLTGFSPLYLWLGLAVLGLILMLGGIGYINIEL